MSQFKKYLEIVTEGKDHVYNESNYDLKDFPGVLESSGADMLTSNLNLLKEALETNLNNMDSVDDIKLMGTISKTLRDMQHSFTDEQKVIQEEIELLMKQYKNNYKK